MNKQDNIKHTTGGLFHLSKWFLDFVGDHGEIMIFYSAKLTWHGWPVSYTSWLDYRSNTGVNLKSRFYNVPVPRLSDRTIIWNDSRYGVSGTWESRGKIIQARLFESPEGGLDWICYQPASKVQLKIKEDVLNGRGYAEQLILTVPPWRIPMDELRWGRFGSDEFNMVWIELKHQDNKQWLWINGERAGNCIIGDDCIVVPERNLELRLDRSILLESEKKISSVVNKLVRYIPGFRKVMPLNFLKADEFKWCSKGYQSENGKTLAVGMAIHELVNFNPQ